MKAKDIIKIIYKHFPRKYALDWDYIGYGSGSANTNISKLLIAFEMSNKVVDYAVAKKCNMIITHHPMYWDGTKKEILESNPIINGIYQRLKENKITHYSPHTAVDGAKNGLNRWYLQLLKADKIKWLKKDLVQIGFFKKPVSFKSIVSKCKKEFQIGSLITNSNKNKISSVMVASGSHGVETIDLSKKHKVDLLITGETKHSSMLHAQEINQDFLLVGHHMESIYAKKVKEIIKKDIPIEIVDMPRKNIIKAV